MSELLPIFPYHPDPVATGAVAKSDAACRACGKARGFIYTGPVYCRESLADALCPWCIADGTAEAKFGARFSDDYPLRSAGLPAAIIEVVTRRTPGYVSWQGDIWLTHCNDACEFHGDLPAERLSSMDPDAKEELSHEHGLTDENWRDIAAHYSPAGQPAIYVFRCRHCGGERYHMDYT